MKHLAFLFFLCVLALPCPALAGDIEASAPNPSKLSLRNETGMLTMLSVTFSTGKAKGETIELSIDPGSSGPVDKPAAPKAGIDFYMGMNDVHFLFIGVPLDQADTLVIGLTAQNRPTIKVLAGGRVIHSGKGKLTQEDLR